MALSTAQIQEQKKQAEELLFSDADKVGFAKTLFFGQFKSSLMFPYPELKPGEREAVDRAVADLRRFCNEKIDASAIDRDADIPQEVIDGLGQLGVLGMTAPTEVGGRGFGQLAYTRIMEVLGGHDAGVAVFVNAHHSIGIRALLLFGTDEQKRRWLPDLVSGRKLGAFALTEPEAGSDAANVQTIATLAPDGRHYLVNGQKRYITNGAIAGMLTVMARTVDPASGESKVTAFLVTPDMPGFEVVEARMPKCGIRGTATARLAFHDMPVPVENVLGQVGKGLRVALTVLDFGRTTFGASCTGAAKFCLQRAIEHANRRVQFKQTLGEFELVQKKIAWMAAHTFAMDAMTTQCASIIDRGFDDYMLETAMLKVFSTEHLWTIVNECLQIHGGQGYFSADPYERMMRDARINLIGEGANEVLKAFIAVVGMRGVGEQLKGVLDALHHPWRDLGKLLTFGRGQLSARLSVPEVPVRQASLQASAQALARRIRDFGLTVQQTLQHFRTRALASKSDASEEMRIMEVVLRSQLQQERISDIACDLYASSCVLSRLDALLTHTNGNAALAEQEAQAGRYFLTLADRRIARLTADLWENDDDATLQTAATLLRK